MGLLDRLTPWRTKDPYWEGFVNRPVADPKHDLSAAIRSAPEGSSFPVKSEIPPPERMSRDLAELAHFLGAVRLGIATTDRALLRPGPGRETDATDDLDALAAQHPFLIMCAVPAEHDPEVAKGMAGQLPVQKAAGVCFAIAAYMRELGYRGTSWPVDSIPAAVAAGLGTVGKDGKLSVQGHGTKVYVGDAVLTDLPLALGSPSL